MASSSCSSIRRMRSGTGGGPSDSLPMEFLEAVAVDVAIKVASENGPLAAGRALVNMFLVCSYWKNVSISEHLWKTLCYWLWDSKECQIGISWREKFIKFQTTFSNFRQGKAKHSMLQYEGEEDGDFSITRRCTCLALTGKFLAAGYNNGAVHVFDTDTKSRICILDHKHDYIFGLYSRAISGIFLDNEEVVLASVSGNLSTGNLSIAKCTSVHYGNAIEDGALISFAGSKTWWVGLYAGSPGHSMRIWSSKTREPLYSGGNLLDDYAMLGWRTFVELPDHFGKVRIVNDSLLVAASRVKLTITDLETQGTIINVEWRQQLAIGALGIFCSRILTVKFHGDAQILSIPALEELCTLEPVLAHADNNTKIIGAMNSRFALLSSDPDFVKVWDAATGMYLYTFRENVTNIYDLVADDMFVAACSANAPHLHFWDFTVT